MNIWEEKVKAMQDEIFRQSFQNMMNLKPIGHLKHEPTGYSLAVYNPISRFKRLMLSWCFGLKYERI